MYSARGRTRNIFFRFTYGDYHKRHRIKALVQTRGSRSVAVRMVKLTAPCCGLADSLSVYIKRILQTYMRQNAKMHLRWLALCLCALRYHPLLNTGPWRVPTTTLTTLAPTALLAAAPELTAPPSTAAAPATPAPRKRKRTSRGILKQRKAKAKAKADAKAKNQRVADGGIL